jgi:hypothetical protein
MAKNYELTNFNNMHTTVGNLGIFIKLISLWIGSGALRGGNDKKKILFW